MMLNWARTTSGMMGRSPDFMNVTFAGWAAAADYLRREAGPSSATTCAAISSIMRENESCLTHALINLQRSRNVCGHVQPQEGTALEVVKETSAGVVVHGARMLATLGPLSDEIAVYSPRLARHSDDHTARSRWASPSLAARRGSNSSAATVSISALAFRPAARLALRGDGLHRVLRRCAGAVGAGVPLMAMSAC